ncbi:Uncharacterized protein BP5553_06450 [Venustampulla echinocandica]|uniref:Uncharacterized protein n=1 Tax=Venustampulla echinocandica TaxID=2656787 RepID=A0A370TJY4_9HELO|nr:Uncharacterized protein BP5553_06450 [Venustampulla echinocandica]RDL35838.1 Uncharacterized protein BP5553_06450 [Venustampulla echinocandica]
MAPIPAPISFDSIAALTSSAVANIAKRIPSIPSSNPNPNPDPNPIPTRTTTPLLTRILSERGTTDSIIPTTYGSINSGPGSGTIAGIVLGSVFGFLLLLWLFYQCANVGVASSAESAYTTETVAVRERRKSHHGGSHRSRRASETVEIRSNRSPIRIVREPSTHRTETIIVDDHRRVPSRSRVSDEVVVIEEHSPPRRKKSSKRSRDERESGFRTVDSGAYGGVVGGSSRRGSSRHG